MLFRSTVYSRIAPVIAALFALPLLAPPCCSTPADDPTMITDVIVGHNNRGPYPLSWTQIDPNSVRVVINGRTLRKSADYKIDLAKGMIGFNSTLLNDAIVRVSYRIIPGKSKRAAGKLNVPITLNLLSRADSNLKLTGLYAQDNPKNPDVGKTVIGIGGDKKWAAGGLSSQFLVSQRSNSDRSANEPDLWRRSAFKFGGDTSMGALKLTGSYVHSGNEFGGAKEYGTGLGKEAADFDAVFAPSDVFQATARFSESESTAGKTKGTRSRLSEESLVYSPGTSTRLSLIHSSTENRTAAAGSETAVDSRLVRLDQKFGFSTSAVATFEDATIAAGGQTDQVRTREMQLTSTPFDRVSLRGGMRQTDSELHGKEQAVTVGATVEPVDQVSVDVGIGTLENETVGHQTTTDVKVTASPIEQVEVTASLSATDSSSLGHTTRTNMALRAAPLDNLQFQGSLAGDACEDQETFQREFSLSSSPAKYAKLTAMFSQKGVDNWDDVTKGGVLQLTPLAHTQFSAGYKYIENGRTAVTIRDYAASSNPWDFFSVSGSFRDRELEEGLAPDSAAVNLSLAPARYFTLTGDYRSNPENKKGVVQHYNSSTLGARTHIGPIGLTTDYTEKDEYGISRLSDERAFGLEFPCFGYGKLTTGYKIARLLDGSAFSTRIYSLGYRHDVGSRFNLSLTGRYTQYLRNQTLMPDQTEYDAEATVGFTF